MFIIRCKGYDSFNNELVCYMHKDGSISQLRHLAHKLNSEAEAWDWLALNIDWKYYEDGDFAVEEA